MSFGFRTATDNGVVQIDGEHACLNLVFSTTWRSGTLSSDSWSSGKSEAGFCWWGYITAIPPAYLTDDHIFVTRCTTAHVAAYRAWSTSGVMKLQMFVHPIGVSAGKHDVEIYVFRAVVSDSGGFGLKVFNEAGGLVYNSGDYPLWVTTARAYADQSVAIPPGTLKAAVSANRLNLLNGGDYGEGNILAPMTFRCLSGEVRTSNMAHINASGGANTGDYTVVDVGNCPVPFSR